MLLAQNHLLAITAGRALVENFYIRYPSGGSGFGFEESTNANVPTLMHVHGGDVYIRNVRIQGDGQADCRGFIVYPTARVLFEGTPPPAGTNKLALSLSAGQCYAALRAIVIVFPRETPASPPAPEHMPMRMRS